MTHVTEDQRTNQRVEVYLLTTILLDSVFESPTWCSIDEWQYDDVKIGIERCQRALQDTQQGIDDLGPVDDLDESSRTASLFAAAACSDCQREIDFVCTELLLYVN
jgi:hypothetical protein